ncbi:hypothetical protein O3S80_21425 [Streptomyces sp. Lzd4kr]|nr:hypothetical protein [Streptomyces sp. Lzd4kr]
MKAPIRLAAFQCVECEALECGHCEVTPSGVHVHHGPDKNGNECPVLVGTLSSAPDALRAVDGEAPDRNHGSADEGGPP